MRLRHQLFDRAGGAAEGEGAASASASGVQNESGPFNNVLPSPCNPTGALVPGDSVSAGLWMNDTTIAVVDGQPLGADT